MTQKTIESLVAQQGQQIVDTCTRLDEHIRKQNGAMERIWDKLDEIGKRPPVWAMVIITILSSTVVGLVVRAVS